MNRHPFLFAALIFAARLSAGEAWQIDFQGGPGGAFGSAPAQTCDTDIGDGATWNAFEIPATNAAVFAKPPEKHNAATDPRLDALRDAQGAKTGVSLAFTGRVSGYNAARVLARGGADRAFGDHWFWGAQGRTSATLAFTFSGLPPGVYSLTVWADPDRHSPARDFGVTVGGKTEAIRPTFTGAAQYADKGSFSATIAGIVVDKGGALAGSLGTLAGDPSLAAMSLKRTGD